MLPKYMTPYYDFNFYGVTITRIDEYELFTLDQWFELNKVKQDNV